MQREFKGKKSSWQAWQSYEEVTVFLAGIILYIYVTDSIHFCRIETFTGILYDNTSPLSLVNEAREDLFCQKNCAMDRLYLSIFIVLFSRLEYGQHALKQDQ